MKILVRLAFLMIIIAFTAPAMAGHMPKKIAGATTVDASTAKALFDNKVVFVDIRKDADWNDGHIPGAKHLFVRNDLSEGSLSKVVGKNDPVLFYCNGEAGKAHEVEAQVHCAHHQDRR